MQRAEDRVGKGRYNIFDDEIVGVYAAVHHADEGGDHGIVDAVVELPADLVGRRSEHVAVDRLLFLLRQRDNIFVQHVGIQLIDLAADCEVFGNRHDDAENGIDIKVQRRRIAEQVQRGNAHRRRRSGKGQRYCRNLIALLIRGENLPLVGKKPVGRRGRENIQKEDQPQVDKLRASLGKIWDHRHEQRSESQEHRADDAENAAVKRHQRLELLHVVFRRGLVHGVGDRRIKAELRQAEHRQHAAEQAVDAQILL